MHGAEVIPDAAVEAAAAAHLEERGESTWEDLTEHGRLQRRLWMRAALEAAAPHMLAQAWEAGGRAATGTYDTGYPAHNPYRSQG